MSSTFEKMKYNILKTYTELAKKYSIFFQYRVLLYRVLAKKYYTLEKYRVLLKKHSILEKYLVLLKHYPIFKTYRVLLKNTLFRRREILQDALDSTRHHITNYLEKFFSSVSEKASVDKMREIYKHNRQGNEKRALQIASVRVPTSAP
jgi:hypothetical protein